MITIKEAESFRETLKIKNFLVIKNAEIEVKKINVIIGPQANGKSLVAKLLYYFKSLSSEILESIRLQHTKRDLDKKLINDFESKFPRYSWEGTSFEIIYFLHDIELRVIGKKNARGKTLLKIEYCEKLNRIFNSKKKFFAKKIAEKKEDSEKHLSREIFLMYEIQEIISKEDFAPFFSQSVFIPASRSFFSNLQKNIFTFLASNIDIDPFLKDFGSLYENSKRFYKDAHFLQRHKSTLDELYKSFESIVVGEYEFSEEQDWIVSKGKKVNLANASSGQQESLPMLLVLCVWPMLRAKSKHNMFFIEEPEAHLFPTSQGHIVSILSLLYKNINTNFFITTHSPYILSALNNFILANDAVIDKKLTVNEFTKMNGSGVPISFDDISAYTITNGVTESISDNEYRMIGADILDNISEHFEHVMNNLLICGERN